MLKDMIWNTISMKKQKTTNRMNIIDKGIHIYQIDKYIIQTQFSKTCQRHLYHWNRKTMLNWILKNLYNCEWRSPKHFYFICYLRIRIFALNLQYRVILKLPLIMVDFDTVEGDLAQSRYFKKYYLVINTNQLLCIFLLFFIILVKKYIDTRNNKLKK